MSPGDASPGLDAFFDKSIRCVIRTSACSIPTSFYVLLRRFASFDVLSTRVLTLKTPAGLHAGRPSRAAERSYE
jgi:hypothetical protein